MRAYVPFATLALGVGVTLAIPSWWAYFAYLPWVASMVWMFTRGTRASWRAAKAVIEPESEVAYELEAWDADEYRACCTSRIGWPHDPRCKREEMNHATEP